MDLLDLGTDQVILRVVLAAVLGGALGLEREIDAQPAGFRTHILIALGAALFGMVSAYGFVAFEVGDRADTNVQIDVTRVASQVVVGIGFLGGGAIIKYGGSVRGLTTAAAMWVTAAVGLAVGLGFWIPAVTVTVAAIGSLVGLREFRAWVARRFGRRSEIVTFALVAGAQATPVLADLRALPGVQVRSVRIERADDTLEVIAGVKTGMGVDLDALLADLAARDDVEQMSLG